VPVVAAYTSVGHTKVAKFGQPSRRPGSVGAFCTPSAAPRPKKPNAQTSLPAPGVLVLTPSSAGFSWEVLFGAKLYERSFQVMSGTIVSMRLSMPAAANWT
jgi:hypothetical protein